MAGTAIDPLGGVSEFTPPIPTLDGDGTIFTSGDDDTGNGSEIDPATLNSGGSSDPDNEPKRRGRKPGSRNRSSTAREKKEVSQDLSGVLLSLHSMMAAMLHIPELNINDDEAKRLSDAAVRVNELYGGFILPEKQLAVITLLMAMGGIYGPRYMAFKMRTAEERKNRGPKVVDMSSGNFHVS